MARLLRMQNASVRGVILIDSPCPTNHEGLPSHLLGRLLKDKPAWLLSNFRRHAVALKNHNPEPHACDVPISLLQSSDLVTPEPSGEDWVAFLNDSTERHNQVKLWEALAGRRVMVDEIPGHHFQAFDSQNVSAHRCAKLSLASYQLMTDDCMQIKNLSNIIAKAIGKMTQV